MKSIKQLVLIIAGVFTLAGVGAVQFAPTVWADNSTDAAKKSACEGAGGTIQADGSCKTDSPSINNIIARIVNILSVLISIVAVIMIMVGGFKYITANGDSGNISGAKNTIIYAVIGLVIVAFAQFIVQFVINETKSKPPADKDKTTTLIESRG